MHIMDKLLEKLYLFCWFVIFLLFLIFLETIDWLIRIWSKFLASVSSCWPRYSSSVGTYAQILNHSKNLQKSVKHVGILICPDEGDFIQLSFIEKIKFLMTRKRKEVFWNQISENSSKNIDLVSLCRIINWCWAAGIPTTTLYDYHGELKSLQKELVYYLMIEMEQSSWAIRKATGNESLPKILIHSGTSTDGNDNNNDLNRKDTNVEAFHIHLISQCDGKQGIVEIAKDVCMEQLNGCDSRASSRVHITERELNSRFQKSFQYFNDPDILIICGNIKSTMGFLPWSIRLSEIFWVPALPQLKVWNFLDVLQKFSGVQQRFGT